MVVTGKAETTDIYKDLKGNKKIEIKLIFAGPKLRLVGVEAFGNDINGYIEVCSMAIGLKLSIMKVMKYNYIAHPSMSAWPFMNPIVMAAEDAMASVVSFFKRRK